MIEPNASGSAAPSLLRIAATRLRFLVVFAVACAVVGGWETVRAYWNRLTTRGSAEASTSSDTEFFCPMDPGILSDWPSKCPVCNMTLVRRKRGEAVPLPDGVLARMQIAPGRLVLGGIETATVDYEPLARKIDLPGVVAAASTGRAKVDAEAFDRELVWLEAGQMVEVVDTTEPGRVASSGTIRSVPRDVAPGSVGKVVIDVERLGLHPGDRVRVRVSCPIDRIEPFRSQATTPPPLRPGELRRLFTCMEHPDILRDAPGPCPRDGLALMPRALRVDQRVAWHCPMHPAVVADNAGTMCAACGGKALVPRVVSYRPTGRVLAMPASAAVDGGGRSIVYIDRGAGMFDARAVTLGPRCENMFPLLDGLEPGDRVVARGAFLIDAETRLDPSLAAGYFGAGQGTHSGKAKKTADDPSLEALDDADRPLALRQKTCPVTGKALGSMGVPLKLKIKGRDVFLCCDGCTSAIESDPTKYLAKLPRENSGGSQP